MKLTTTFSLLALAASTSAFAPNSGANTNKKVKTSRKATDIQDASQSLPFLKRPEVLDGELAGDVGFDPFNFSKTKEDLLKFRDAEIKHARLAMLAAAGWPISELFDRPIANELGLDPVVDLAGRAPSVLNGGLDHVSPVYWTLILAVASAIELYGEGLSKKPNWEPGNLGFDPWLLYPKDEEGQKRMRTAEIKNGRLAMIAITAFAAQEFVTKLGVTNEHLSNLFFHPTSYINQF